MTPVRLSTRPAVAALAMQLACGHDASAPSTGSSTSSSEGTDLPPDTAGEIDSTLSEGSSSGGDPGDPPGASSSTGEPDGVDPRGYTLFAPMASRYTYLMDADGLEINRWQSEAFPANAAYMRPRGHMLRVSRDPDADVELASGAGGIVEEFSWEGEVVWRYEHTGPAIVAHHDIEPLPDEHVIIVAYEMFSVADAIAAGRDPTNVPPEGLWADYLVEVDPATDEIVWEWHVWDHLIQDYDPLAENYGVVGDHPERIDINWTRDRPQPDWTHTNAVDYSATLDQIMLSSRTFSEIWVIDHSTTTEEAAGGTGGRAGMGGDLLYRWGNSATYHAGQPLDRELYFQHSPRWIDQDKPGGGRILVFDNGHPTLRPWSRVLEIETPVLPDGTYARLGPSFEPSDPSWIYEDPENFFSTYISSADRLTDGRTLVCDGPSGALFEIDAMGRVGWTHEVSATVFRAERYEADHPAWDGLSGDDLVPGDPVRVDVEAK